MLNKIYKIIAMSIVVVTLPLTLYVNSESATEVEETIEVEEEPIPQEPEEIIVIIEDKTKEEEEPHNIINDLMDMKQTTYDWFNAYRTACNLVEDAPEDVYDYYTEDEVKLICRVVENECRGASFAAKVHIAEVVFNRVENPEFPNTVKGVVNQENQFSNYKTTYGDDTVAAVEYAFCMPDETCGALFFQVAKVSSWYGYSHVYRDECHSFYG